MCRPGAVSAVHLARQLVKPTLGQAGQLVADSRRSSWSRFVSAYAQQESHLQQAMERMTTPWLDAQKTMRSIAGFAELHGIGKAISNAKGFEDSLSAVLRRWSAPCTIRLTYRLCRQDCSLCDGVTNRRSYHQTGSTPVLLSSSSTTCGLGVSWSDYPRDTATPLTMVIVPGATTRF